MRRADYASMVRSIGEMNKNDREAHPSLPEVLITDHGGNKAEVDAVVRNAVDPVDPKPEKLRLLNQLRPRLTLVMESTQTQLSAWKGCGAIFSGIKRLAK